LPLGVTNRILNKHDFILILVQSLELAAWSKQEKDGTNFFLTDKTYLFVFFNIKLIKGKFFKYIDNKWKLVPSSERFQLSKIEGQVWISLYELILNPQCLSKYDYTDYKKNQILKVNLNKI
jgi:hypothetical protein